MGNMVDKKIFVVVRCSDYIKRICGKCAHGVDHVDKLADTDYACSVGYHGCIMGKRGTIACRCLGVQ